MARCCMSDKAFSRCVAIVEAHEVLTCWYRCLHNFGEVAHISALTGLWWRGEAHHLSSQESCSGRKIQHNIYPQITQKQRSVCTQRQSVTLPLALETGCFIWVPEEERKHLLRNYLQQMRWRINILFGFYCPLLSDLRCCLFYKMLHGEVGAAPFHTFPYATKRPQLFVRRGPQQLHRKPVFQVRSAWWLLSNSGMLHFSFLMWKLPQPSTCIVGIPRPFKATLQEKEPCQLLSSSRRWKISIL